MHNLALCCTIIAPSFYPTQTRTSKLFYLHICQSPRSGNTAEVSTNVHNQLFFYICPTPELPILIKIAAPSPMKWPLGACLALLWSMGNLPASPNGRNGSRGLVNYSFCWNWQYVLSEKRLQFVYLIKTIKLAHTHLMTIKYWWERSLVQCYQNKRVLCRATS